MPIQTVDQRHRLPILGKIRLGIRKESQSGNLYPSTVEHFVLKDAPEVAKVYGQDPKELEVMFPANDLETVVPTWLKWYAGGARGKDGKIIGGRLQCYGNGPDTEGKPGLAHHLAKRDPVTRIVPTRPCLGPSCPDYADRSGNQQCKQSMQVLVFIPQVSMDGVYQIDTTSWHSIQSFHSQLTWTLNVYKTLTNRPFKIVREETPTKFFDKDGKEKSGKQYIMRLKPLDVELFIGKYGEEMKRRLAVAAQISHLYQLPEKQALIEAPMEDNFVAEALPAPTAASAEVVAADQEVQALFAELEKVTGKPIPEKARVIAIRKKEGEEDMRGAVIATLKQKIAEAHTQQKPAEVQAPQQPTGGII